MASGRTILFLLKQGTRRRISYIYIYICIFTYIYKAWKKKKDYIYIYLIYIYKAWNQKVDFIIKQINNQQNMLTRHPKHREIDLEFLFKIDLQALPKQDCNYIFPIYLAAIVYFTHITYISY